jgi:hypothetical protein
MAAKAAMCLFRSSSIPTLHRYTRVVEHMLHNQMSTSVDQLLQPTHALLHALYSIQQATGWTYEDRENTTVFTPTEVNYNPLRLQAQQYVLILQDPTAVQNTIKFAIKPPRIRSYKRGDEAWTPWWRTALLVQSPDLLPLPAMSHDKRETTGYLRYALQQALYTTGAFLSSMRELTNTHS